MISDERGRAQRWGGRQSVCTHLQLLTEASALLGGLGELGLEPGDHARRRCLRPAHVRRRPSRCAVREHGSSASQLLLLERSRRIRLAQRGAQDADHDVLAVR